MANNTFKIPAVGFGHFPCKHGNDTRMAVLGCYFDVIIRDGYSYTVILNYLDDQLIIGFFNYSGTGSWTDGEFSQPFNLCQREIYKNKTDVFYVNAVFVQ